MSQAIFNQSFSRSAWSYLSRSNAAGRTQSLVAIALAAVLAGCASPAPKIDPVIVRPAFPCTPTTAKAGPAGELTQLPLQIELDARAQLPGDARAVGYCWYLQEDGKLFADQGSSGFLFRKRLTRWVGPKAWAP